MKREAGFVLDAIAFAYKDHHILRGAFLSLRPGEICGLIGRNGCGKSTLTKIGAGQLTQRSGIVMIDGDRFTAPVRRKRFERIAYLPQQSMAPRMMSVRRLIGEFERRGGEVPKDDRLIAPLLTKRIGSLSTGERRYLECLLVLGLNRRYVLLDEPFTGLAPVTVEQLSRRIRKAADDGCGILLSDHYSQYVLPLVDSLFGMAHGRCRPLDPTADVRAQLDALMLGKRF